MIKPIKPQPGPQEAFLSTPADIAIYGGAAGGGKTWGLLMEPLRHIANPQFGAVCFRRTTVQVRNEGGLWDESANLYPGAGGAPKEHLLSWEFASGANVTFAHLEHDKTVLNWQGSQIPLIMFDELTHFTARQFWYMVSRNRSMCGVKPYIRATCNPDPDSFVTELISWWIDPETGYAIPERSGVVRWFVRAGDTLYWADNPDELAHHTMINDAGDEVPIPAKSLTFISAKLTDNKALMQADPGYMANLLALSSIERERLLGGNWKISASGGIFKDEWWQYRGAAPAIQWRSIYADTAMKAKEQNDYSVFQCWGKTVDGQAILLDMVRGKFEAPELLERARAFWAKHAATQGQGTLRAFKIEDKASGTGLIQQLRREGKPVIGIPRSAGQDKITRAYDAAPYIESGNVLLMRDCPHLSDLLAEASGFPNAAHDDTIDPMMDAIMDILQPAPEPTGQRKTGRGFF